MTTLTDPPKETFRLSMLIYDTRYRSLTIQCVALIGFMLFAAWLINNTLTNLATLGKPIEFGFFSDPASYDINQRLLEYNSRDTHLWASTVGLLNTLVVAILGCITATIIGVFVGVLRLSNNWLVARLMTIYVEMFRNVPVLLWIVLALAILIESLPEPKELRGDEVSMSLFGTTAFTNQGVFIPRPIPSDLGWLLLVVFIASIFVIRWNGRRADKIQEATGDRPVTIWTNLGLFFGPVLVVYFVATAITSNDQYAYIGIAKSEATDLAGFTEAAGRITYCHASGRGGSLNGMRHLVDEEVKFKRRDYYNMSAARENLALNKCNLVAVDAGQADRVKAELQEAAAATPATKDLVVSVLAADYTQGRALEFETAQITAKGIPKMEGGTHLRNSLIALWLALSLYTAAFIAEIVRAGIMAVSKGQSEAAGALGLRPNRIMALVVLPQAMRVIIPPLISNWLNLTKNSSLAIAVGYMDITGTLGGITMNQTGRELECVLLLMLVYLSISLTISAAMNWYNNRVKLVER